MIFSSKNIEIVRYQVQKLYDISKVMLDAKVMLDVQKEYNSLLLTEEQERDEK